MNQRGKTVFFVLLPLSVFILVLSNLNGLLLKLSNINGFHSFSQFNIDSFRKRHPITFVSAFINIGTIEKHGGFVREKSTYLKWMREYGRLDSPMIIFSNDLEFIEEVSKVRYRFIRMTKVIYLDDLYNMTGFKHIKKIENLFANPKYPKVRGVTTNPRYCCIMHSKYDLLEIAIENNYFRTPYVAWSDIGYLRNMGGSNDTLNVTLPPKFNDSRIAFNKIYDLNRDMSISDVMKKLSMWVGGGFFLGKASVMLKFIHQYRNFVDKMIERNLMSTDENIIFAMYTKEGYTADMVDIQLYYGPDDKCDYWFHIIYLITNHSCLRNDSSLMNIYS